MPLSFPGLAVLVLTVFLSACSAGEEGADTSARAWQNEIPEGQLSNAVQPVAYDLELEIDPVREQFSGRVAIGIRLTEARDGFWMHGKDLDVADVSIQTADGNVIPGAYEQRHRDGISLVTLDEEVPAQEATLTLEFAGRFADDASGLFRSGADGEFYVFSEFQPILARSAFPSFDEPRFKTPFTVSIVTRDEYLAFSNGPEIGAEKLDDGRKRVRFATTQPLPTYLVAFAVGPLDVVEWEPVPANAWRREPLALRGIAARGRGDSLEFALENTAPMLAALEDYFESPYPYDKLDLVAAVGYSGAMEHAGLITYSEYTLLLDEDASLARQEDFGSTHAHELAHQWLGNLVTMAWWDDLWMNESFASWMESRLMTQWRPDMHYERTRLSYTHRAMDRDSLASSRRVREPVNDAAGMWDAFDSATYSKGAAVIRMIEDYVGAETFRGGMIAFLDQFAHGTATAFDLVDALEEEIGADAGLQRIFRGFLFQPGVPYVMAELSCDETGGRIALSQARYVPEGSLAPVEGDWATPVCVRWDSDGNEEQAEKCRLLDSTSTDIAFDGRCPSWYMPNKGARGYYRWQVLPEAVDLLDHSGESFGDLERMSLADSLAARMFAGDLGADRYLAAVPALAAALERAVATAPLDELEMLLEHVVAPGDIDAARAYLGAIYRRRLEFVALPGGSESVVEAKRLRSRLIQFLAGVIEDPLIREDLGRQGREYVGFGGDGRIHRDAVEPDLAEAAVAVAAREAGPAFFDHLTGLLGTESSPETRSAILAGIGAVRDPVLLARARNLLLDEIIYTNEVPLLLGALSQPAVIDGTWAWVAGNVERLMRRYPGSYAYWAPAHFEGFCSSDRATDVRGMFEPFAGSIPGIERTIDKTGERILICAAFRTRHADSVSRFLRDIGKPEGDPPAEGIAAQAEEG